MNTLERRLIVRDQVIDASIAKTAINKSRRERADAARKLRKIMAANRFETMESDTVSYPRQAAG